MRVEKYKFEILEIKKKKLIVIRLENRSKKGLKRIINERIVSLIFFATFRCELPEGSYRKQKKSYEETKKKSIEERAYALQEDE